MSKYIILPSAIYTTQQTIESVDITDPKNSFGQRAGIEQIYDELTFFLNITSVPTIQTLNLSFDMKDPASGVWANVCATLPIAVTGMVMMKIAPNVSGIAATTLNLVLNNTVPLSWRVNVVPSSNGNFTYSLGMTAK